MAQSFSQSSSEPPVALAEEVNGAFRFRCPHCATRLTIHRIVCREPGECPSCGGGFQIATRALLRREQERRARAEAAAMADVESRLAAYESSGEPPPDRISVFGITSSGKSVFLAALYHALWTGIGGLSARALHGEDHQHLLQDFATLQAGQWLSATNRTRNFDLALAFHGVKATLSSLDYPGEVFTDVFYRRRLDAPEQARLYQQLRSTMGAILLIDPEQVVAGDGQRSRLDVEFTAVEVVEQLATRGMGDHVVVALTKRNQNKYLIDAAGGPGRFLRQHMPRLCEAARSLPVLHISSVPTRVMPDATRLPDIRPGAVSAPLRVLETLLNRIDPAWLQFLERLDQEALEAARAMEGDAAGTGGVA